MLLGILDGEVLEDADRGGAGVGEDALFAEFGLFVEGVEELACVGVAEPGDELLRGEVVHGGHVEEGESAGEVVEDKVGDMDVRGEKGGGKFLRPFGAL